jgi:hypothetical protein
MSLVVTVTPVSLLKPDLPNEKNYSRHAANNNLLNKQRDYARKAVHHGLVHKEHYEAGNSPFNGDLIYSQMFDTNNPQELEIYKKVGRSWMHDAKEAHVYIDLGLTKDMIEHIDDLIENDLIIKFKTLSSKKIIQRAVESLKSVEQAAEFLNIQQNAMSYEDYKMDYIQAPKNEKFENKEYKPCHYEKGEFKRVIMESPFAGNVERNVHYAKALMHKLAHEGYAPSASHLLYTQSLDDTLEFDRNLGINKGLDYAHNKDSIIGIDLGISTGMKYGVKRAINEGRNYRFDTLSTNENVINEVGKINNLEEAEEYVNKQKEINQNTFKLTGYINDNFLSDKLLNKEKQVSSKKLKV